MDQSDDIRNYVLEFFAMVGSDMSKSEHSIYQVSIPEQYQSFFNKSELVFTFDGNIASRYRCELVNVGSHILSAIIRICSTKGPISLKKSKGVSSGHIVIRCYFFVNFSSIINWSKVISVDIDWNTLKSVTMSNHIEDNNFSSNMIKNDPKRVTNVYISALKELEIKCINFKSKFLTDVNTLFQKDFKLLVKKYDAQIRELNETINEKMRTTEDVIKSSEFRFETVKKIEFIEKEKLKVVETLQRKYHVMLEYRLVACEIISN